MEEIIIKIPNKEPISLLIEKKPGDKIAIFVSGSGDTKDSLQPIASLLNDGINYSLCSFAFRGRETNKEYPATQQIDDLKDVLDFMLEAGYKKFILIPTSMGFISTASVLADPKYSMYIEKVLMLDPADYPVDMYRGTWSGDEEFSPVSELYSDKLKLINNSSVIIDVVFFGLRNYDFNYKDRINKERGVDDPKLFSRLNKNMSQNIFQSIPAKNRGKFIEDNILPHAFSRDGNIEKNYKVLVSYLKNLI